MQCHNLQFPPLDATPGSLIILDHHSNVSYVEDSLTVMNHEAFLDKFVNPHPTHLSMTVPVDGSGLMTNLTSRNSLMFLSVSIPYGDSIPTRIFETSCGHNAQRRNNKPCQMEYNSDKYQMVEYYRNNDNLEIKFALFSGFGLERIDNLKAPKQVPPTVDGLTLRATPKVLANTSSFGYSGPMVYMPFWHNQLCITFYSLGRSSPQTIY